MNVLAFAKSVGNAWRWRIVDYSGNTVEESSATFATIGEAVTAGAQRLGEHTDRARQTLVWPAGY
jgi:hypothetical protein